MTTASSDLVYFNGLDGTTGGYLIPPMSPAQLARLAQGEELGPGDLAELKARLAKSQKRFGVKEGVDATDLGQAGWGVIFAADAKPDVKDALSELLAHRQRQAEALKPRFQVYDGHRGFRPTDTKNEFLKRLGMGPGPANPDKVPYYLLIVGHPEVIPYSFQSQLDVAYAVGRIAFDALDDYARYAHSVVQAETGNLVLPRRATFFGTRNPGDGATDLSATHLVGPLATAMAADHADWTVDTVLAADATKARLGGMMGGDQTPSLLFTASHGIGLAPTEPRQRAHQGALVCQDWPGPEGRTDKPFSSDWYFSADDVTAAANLFGLIAFQFACFGAGTPRYDEFAHLDQGVRQRTEIAPAAFVAGLPRRLLSHPNGGALAVIGHVERAWGTSFVWDGAGAQLTVFQSTLERLMKGHPVGHAVEYFNDRYAQLSVDLNVELEDIKYGKTPEEIALSGMWTANNDARGYSVVGDPAVRLMVGDDPPAERPTAVAVVGGRAEPVSPPPVPAGASTGDPSADPTADLVPTPGQDPYFLGLGGSGLDEIRDRLATGLQDFVDKLTATLAAVLDDATSLEVETYVSDDLAGVRYVDGHFAAPANLRALTRVNLDGDTYACVPQIDGGIDTDLWRVHMELVAQAQASRAALIDVAASAAASLVGALKGLS